MKRLANLLSWALIVCILCCVGMSVALIRNRKTLHSVYSARPTATNTTAFKMNRRTVYAPANLLRRRTVLGASFFILLAMTMAAGIALVFVKSLDAKLARIKAIELQRFIEGKSDFTVSDNSISWIIPTAAKLATFRSRRSWLPFLVTVLIGWFVLDLLFRLSPDGSEPPELTATLCAACVMPFYFFMMIILVGYTSIVTLNDQGIMVQLAGKTGRRAICPYGSVLSCWIEPTPGVPSLPCFAFRSPRKLRAEKTSHLEMPADADVQSLIQFLAARGVTCVDRR